MENYRRGATRPYVERLRRRRVYTAARRDLDATQRKRSPPRDRSEGGTIGRIEVNGNGGNGVSYVRLVENRWPSIFTPPLVSIRRDRRGWPCFSGLKGERFSGRKKEEERGNEREKKGEGEREREEGKKGRKKNKKEGKEKKNGRRRTGW